MNAANAFAHAACTRVLTLAALSWLMASQVNAQFTLVEKGRSSARIVIPADAIPSERYAAEELQRYIERISGARLEIVGDTARPGRTDILLGDNAHLRTLKNRPAIGPLGEDGCVLRTSGSKLILAGGRPRGTLNGVYTFLEEELGVRWFTPELERVLNTNRIRIPKVDRTVVPALESRDVFWREMMRDADFASRHRLNGQHYALKPKHGGAFTVYHPFVHSFDALVPPELCKDHPEYWPMIKGERKSGYVQRCLTHPDVIRISIERVRQWIAEHPEATIISVSQNDCFNNCECPTCKALDDAEGSPAGSLLQYVNAIAAAIEKEYPRIRIDTLAYQYTRRPPKTLRPHPKVIIRLCSIECCFAHSLDGCTSKANREFGGDIVAWQPVAPLLYVWDYTPNFAHYLQTFPNFDALQANVKFFVNHGVKGLFEQGNYSTGGQGEMGPLRAYLLAKLLWNPDTDVARHLREFTDAYYGAAAGKVREAIQKIHEPVRGQECHAHIFDGPKSCYLDPGVLDAAERLYDEAEGLAADETSRFHVQVARLPFWYSRLAQNRVKGEDRKNLARRFLEIAHKAGVSNISEGRSLDDWGKSVQGE
jgi:hypothetical protein